MEDRAKDRVPHAIDANAFAEIKVKCVGGGECNAEETQMDIQLAAFI
jgi:hypothetical protein